MTRIIGYILTTSLSLMLMGEAWAKTKSSSAKKMHPTIKLIKALDNNVAKRMPQRLAQTPLESVFVKKNVIAYKVHGVQFLFEVNSKEGLIRMNGQVFHSHEVTDVMTAKKAIERKLKKPQGSLASFLVKCLLPQAWAESKKDKKSFNFFSRFGISAPPFSSLSGLSEFLSENQAEEAMDIAASLLTSIAGFGERNSSFNKLFKFGSSGGLPDAPNFSTSPSALK